MNIAFVCNTPIQIFNSIKIIFSNVEDSKGHSDIYIVNRFVNSKRIYERIISAGIFNNVYYVEDKKNKGVVSVRRILLNRIKPYREFDIDGIDTSIPNYDKIFIADTMPFGIELCENNKKSEVILYEGGIPIYSGKFYIDSTIGRRAEIIKFLKKGVFSINPQKAYVNRLSLNESKLDLTFYEIPMFNVDDKAKLCDVFDYKKSKSLLNDFKVIFFDQRFDDFVNFKNLNFVELLDQYQEKVLIRLHPRTINSYPGCKVDSNPNMWEVECLTTINDEKILIGYFSTAMFSPFILAKKEPTLIFLYKLLAKDLNAYDVLLKNTMIDRIKTSYSNPDKVLVPSTIEEFNTLMTKILEQE